MLCCKLKPHVPTIFTLTIIKTTKFQRKGPENCGKPVKFNKEFSEHKMFYRPDFLYI